VDQRENVTWLVCFTEGHHWATPFLKQGFGHVFLVREWGPLWVLVDPSVSHTQLQLVPQANFTLQDITRDARVLRYEGSVDCATPRVIGPFTCVEIVKSFLGIGALIFTPYQLWRHLNGRTFQRTEDAEAYGGGNESSTRAAG
tara:strand:- start:5292 stop:5720 length:429 start_codon:yes stop_codon:yes gene_type:complete